ncbi:hypothetical protein H696_06387 [Fonticula alba]|uniref:Uncharacterized protein n=1 Tax=Fonticula alba TaxID=691883 RepID=A0A058YYX4_FONAL|nr:hypothetical protein H696_06387 [Fonticula alba]KCV67194.1 hypothetical protein H696_06387 [Fonticula alba]|eukprot:XP_009498401.1 hypothetical protein H696_06387 [Fonticula alba]
MAGADEAVCSTAGSLAIGSGPALQLTELDVTQSVGPLLRFVHRLSRLGERFTAIQIVDAWMRGSAAAKDPPRSLASRKRRRRARDNLATEEASNGSDGDFADQDDLDATGPAALATVDPSPFARHVSERILSRLVHTEKLLHERFYHTAYTTINYVEVNYAHRLFGGQVPDRKTLHFPLLETADHAWWRGFTLRMVLPVSMASAGAFRSRSAQAAAEGALVGRASADTTSRPTRLRSRASARNPPPPCPAADEVPVVDFVKEE